MKFVLKLFCLTLLLAACATTQTAVSQNSPLQVKKSLTDRVQEIIVETQKNVTETLPDDIAGLKSAEPVADREKNQRGAGFTRVYTDGDIVATVFIYNNQEFGMGDEVTPATESLMDKHLQEFQAMQESGLYTGVKTGSKKPRDFRWRTVKYQVLESDIQFSQRGEAKKSLLVLGSNKDLMSYIRIRYTYPKSKQSEINKKHPVFTRTVFVALHDFVKAQQESAAE